MDYSSFNEIENLSEDDIINFYNKRLQETDHVSDTYCSTTYLLVGSGRFHGSGCSCTGSISARYISGAVYHWTYGTCYCRTVYYQWSGGSYKHTNWSFPASKGEGGIKCER